MSVIVTAGHSAGVLVCARKEATAQRETMPFCTRCGARVYPDARYCTSCGHEVDLPTSNVYVFALADDEEDPNYSIDFFEVDLVGEWRFADEFDELLGEVDDDDQRELDDVTAVLIREPGDPGEPDAVTVQVWDGESTYRRVGRMSSADAESYAGVLQELEKRTGRIVGCFARVHVVGPNATCDQPIYSARVYLPAEDAWLRWRL